MRAKHTEAHTEHMQHLMGNHDGPKIKHTLRRRSMTMLVVRIMWFLSFVRLCGCMCVRRVISQVLHIARSCDVGSGKSKRILTLERLTVQLSMR